MTEIKIYYWDIETDEFIDGNEPITASLSQALNKLNELSKVDGSFIGIEFSNNYTIQFMYNTEGLLYFDVIDSESENTYGKNVNISEANDILQDVFRGKSPMQIENLESSENENSSWFYGNSPLNSSLIFLGISCVSLLLFVFLLMWFIFPDWGNPFINLSAFSHNSMYTCAIGIPLIAISLYGFRKNKK